MGIEVKVADIMSENPITVNLNSTVRDAADMMYEADVRHIPVVEEGELRGMVSDRDIRSFSFSFEEQMISSEDFRAHMQTEITDIVQIDVISTNPEAEVREVIDLMVDQKVGALPVVQPRDNKLVGIISYVDVLKALRKNILF